MKGKEMNKYDVELDMESKNSLSIIANNIHPDSLILEFGPATGRLTKYLKEELNCQVYIVEIDDESYHKALKYAEDGSCGDMEKYQWAEKFQGLKFDAIIFADVLEHLIYPEKVVAAVGNFLKKDGKIIASAPNIAHDSIIVNLLEDVFQYNKTGLLDNTHVHFFTYNSLKSLFKNNGFSITIEEATYLNDDIGEFPFGINSINDAQKEVLANHKYGHVYQFVFFAVKSEDFNEEKNKSLRNIIPKKNNEMFGLYANIGLGFSETDKLITEVNPGYNKIIFDLKKFKEVTELRLDFNDSGNCIVTIENIIIDGKPVGTKNIKGNYVFSKENKYYFCNEDPNLFLKQPNVKDFEIDFYFEKLPNSGLNILKEFDLISECTELTEKWEKLNAEKKKCEDDLRITRHQLMIKTNKYNAIVNSKIWKMTQPLRKSAMLVRKLKK